MAEKIFFNGITIDKIGKRAHVFNNSHERCVESALDKNLHKDSLCTGYRALLLFTLKIHIYSLCKSWY